MLVAPAHEGPDGGGRRVEDRHAIALDDLPEARLVGPVGRALVHHDRRAVGERTVDDVAVARHPADVGGAPVDVFVLHVEDPLGGRVAADQVAGRRVDDALRLPRRPGRVEDVEHVLGVHRLGLETLPAGLLHQAVIPVVAPLLDVDREARRLIALDDDDVADRRRVLQRLVGHLLERHQLPAAIAAVGGDQHRALRIVDAVAQRLRAEAAEHHAVHRAEAGAGEHGDGQLRHQRHVERDAIALLDAEAAQHVRERVDVAVEVEVGQRAPVAGLAFPDQRGLVAARRADVAIEAVGRDVQAAAAEPLGVGRLPLEHRRERRDPLEFVGEPGPERLGILGGAGIDARIVGVGRGREGGRRRKGALFDQERGDLGRRIVRLRHGTPQRPGRAVTVISASRARGRRAAPPRRAAPAGLVASAPAAGRASPPGS